MFRKKISVLWRLLGAALVAWLFIFLFTKFHIATLVATRAPEVKEEGGSAAAKWSGVDLVAQHLRGIELREAMKAKYKLNIKYGAKNDEAGPVLPVKTTIVTLVTEKAVNTGQLGSHKEDQPSKVMLYKPNVIPLLVNKSLPNQIQNPRVKIKVRKVNMTGKKVTSQETDSRRSHQECPSLHLTRAITHKQHFQKVDKRPVYVFSAHYDNRKEIGSPKIRIIAAGLQTDYNQIPPMYCILWYKFVNGTFYGLDGGMAAYEVIYRSTLWPKMYTSHFILCIMSTNQPRPVGVSVSHTPCQQTTNELLVNNVLPPGGVFKHNFSLCVSPLYGNIPQKLIFEFIEIHKAMGVQKLIFYDHKISDSVKALLGKYPPGAISVVDWKFPPVEQSYFMQRVALNDCIYRNMAISKYVGIYDLDEVAVPRTSNTWEDLFRMLQGNYSRTGAFLFQHAYFRRNSTLKGENAPFITQTSLWRTNRVTPPGKIRCKSVYYAQRALAVDIHFPYRLLPGYLDFIVDPRTAMLHHYRETPMSNFNKQKDIKFVLDPIMKRYEKHLNEKYKLYYKTNIRRS